MPPARARRAQPHHRELDIRDRAARARPHHIIEVELVLTGRRADRPDFARQRFARGRVAVAFRDFGRHRGIRTECRGVRIRR